MRMARIVVDAGGMVLLLQWNGFPVKVSVSESKG